MTSGYASQAQFPTKGSRDILQHLKEPTRDEQWIPHHPLPPPTHRRPSHIVPFKILPRPPCSFSHRRLRARVMQAPVQRTQKVGTTKEGHFQAEASVHRIPCPSFCTPGFLLCFFFVVFVCVCRFYAQFCSLSLASNKTSKIYDKSARILSIAHLLLTASPRHLLSSPVRHNVCDTYSMETLNRCMM